MRNSLLTSPLLLFLLLLLPALPSALAETVTVTAPPSIPSDEPSYESASVFTSAVLNSTNYYRAAHNASDLAWNKTLARFAADYLDDNEDCEFEHSGGPYGENLAIGYQNVTAAVEAWGDERDEYDFGDGGFSEETGHFTQLVWRDTEDVGCASKLCGRRGWFLVCEYWPRGNVKGAYQEQVMDDEEEGSVGRAGVSGPLVLAVVVGWTVLLFGFAF